jgi:hypothetical protein
MHINGVFINPTSIALIKISLNFNHVCVCSMICPKSQVKEELNEVIKRLMPTPAGGATNLQLK